jgi:hypothetical protein
VSVRSDDEVELGRARAKRWWLAGRRVGSVERAAAFIDDVGFALLFPAPRVPLPSLWEAVAGDLITRCTDPCPGPDPSPNDATTPSRKSTRRTTDRPQPASPTCKITKSRTAAHLHPVD